MTNWFPIHIASTYIQEQANIWKSRMLPGDWVHEVLSDLDGSIIVLYYLQRSLTPSKILWTRLDQPK